MIIIYHEKSEYMYFPDLNRTFYIYFAIWDGVVVMVLVPSIHAIYHIRDKIDK